MSVSNSDNFTLNRNEIIAQALYSLGKYRVGATISTSDYNFCSNWLNIIVKSWDNQGIHMWTQVEGTLFLRNGINTYTVSTTSSDNAGNNTVETLLTADATSTTLTVTSTTGMNIGDYIGIELDANTRQWTTIVSVDSSTQVTITIPLTSIASTGRTVCTYTTPASKPLYISKAVFRNSAGTDVPIKICGKDEFLEIPNKTNTTSTISRLFYSPNRSDGEIRVWGTPDSCSGRIHYNYTRMLYDFDTSTDNADFPSEWFDCLILNLMDKISLWAGKDIRERAEIKQNAREALISMQLSDVNGSSVRIIPEDSDDC